MTRWSDEQYRHDLWLQIRELLDHLRTLTDQWLAHDAEIAALEDLAEPPEEDGLPIQEDLPW